MQLFFPGGEASREIDIDGEIRKRARPKSMAITGSPLKANGDVPKSNPSFFEDGSSPTNGTQGTGLDTSFLTRSFFLWKIKIF